MMDDPMMPGDGNGGDDMNQPADMPAPEAPAEGGDDMGGGDMGGGEENTGM